MAITITPEQYAEKQARNLKAANADIRRGVAAVTEAPTIKAAAAKDKMLLNLTAAINDGKWERGLRRVSLEEWKSKMIDKGIPRIAAGIDAAHDKVVAFATELLAFETTLLRRIEALPDLTLDDNINRATEWMRGMSTFRRSS